MKAVLLDGSTLEVSGAVRRLADRTIVTIPRQEVPSRAAWIDFDYWGPIARDGDAGYMVLPGSVQYGDMLCGFSGHRDTEYVADRYTMPIFGVKTDSVCFVAIVSGMAYDYSLVAGVRDGSYYLYPRFRIDGETPYEDICVEYHFLRGEDADYSGMARRYRQYQLERGACRPICDRMRERPCLEYAAESVLVRIRQGWKPVPPAVLHQTPQNEPPMKAACTFGRVLDILNEFKRQGVPKAEICLVGWNAKGHDGRWPQTFPVCEELGGEEKLKNVIKTAQAMGYQITCHTNSTDAYEVSELWDPDDIIRTKEGALSATAKWSGGLMYELCPQKACSLAEKILPEVARLGFRGLHYIDVMSIVMPRRCCSDSHPVNVRESIEWNEKIMGLAKKLFGGFCSEGGFDFASKFLDFGLYLSRTDENKPELCDRLIPLWQLVYHGIILSNPSAETINYALKGPKKALRLVEYGGRPSFYYYSKFIDDSPDGSRNWMGGIDLTCDDEEQLRDSVSKIKESCDRYQKLSRLQTEFMEKHEEIAENVYRVTYSDGTAVTVDYNRETYQIARE